MNTSPSPIRVGICGAGFMGRTHAQHLQRIDGVEVAAVVSRSRASASALAEKLAGTPRVCASFDEMLDTEPLDAVYLCMPPGAHAGQVEAAAGRGVHLFLEKPIALTMDRARAMRDAVRVAGVTCVVGYHYRMASPVRQLKQRIASGEAGRPTLLQGVYACNALHTPWWRDAAQSGGQLLEQAIHLIDLAIHLFGRPRWVSAAVDNLVHRDVDGYTGDDTSALIVRFENGAIANLAATNCAVPGQWTLRFEAVCERLTARFGDPAAGVLIDTADQAAPQTPLRDERDLKELESRAFIDAIRGHAAPFATIDDGLLGLAVALAAHESAREGGQPVKIDPH